MPTDLVYLEDSEQYESTSHVVRVDAPAFSPQRSVILDATIFYPQGGGQPTDRGILRCRDEEFRVDKVTFVDGEVLHTGVVLKGEGFASGDEVTLAIDISARQLHARLHTGGHLVMTAVDRLLKLPATKGYHFPDGPYVEFGGDIPPEDRESVSAQLQEILDGLVAEDSEVTARFESIEVLRELGVHIPAEIPAGKPTRVVITSGYYSPCGGTHVRRLGQLTGLQIRGIKVKSGHARVSYTIA